MTEQTQEIKKRSTAVKLTIGDINSGKQIIDQDKLKFIELGTKQIFRVNLIANIIDKYVQDGEKKYATLTLDDASGQIKIKSFGEDIEKLSHLNPGETIMIVGLLRSWNNEVYITPEIIKKKEPIYLLIRKKELDLSKPLNRPEIAALKDKIIEMIKKAEATGGIDNEKLILDLHEPPEIINQEIKKLLEDGIAYEPRPGKIRYLG
jgi:RecG-like helicase